MRLGNSNASVTAEAAESGVWIDSPFGGLRVKIRHPASSQYRSVLRRFRDKYVTAEADQQEELYKEAVVIGITADVSGMVDVNGVSLEFSPELFESIVANKDNRPFVDWIYARSLELSEAEAFEALLKNCGSVSLGA